jgi:hypothetical protein
MQWVPSRGRHAYGESHCFPLVRLTNDTPKFCLGCIGTDERRFCQSTACNIVSHKKRRHNLGCKDGFFIPAGGQSAVQSCTIPAFRTPFLDATRLTAEVWEVVTSKGQWGMKTTREWEEYILHAEVAWHAYQEEVRTGLRGTGIQERSDEDDTFSMSGISVGDEPSTFKFWNPPTFGNLKFRKCEDQGEDTDGDVMEDAKEDEEIREIWEVIKDLDTRLLLFVEAVRVNQVSMMDYYWNSIIRLKNYVGLLSLKVRGLKQDVGDASEVLDKHNLIDLSEGIMRVLSHLASTPIPNLEDIKARLVALGDLINAVDEDHQKAEKYLLTKLREITSPQDQGAQGGSGGASTGTLALDMPIVNGAGVAVRTLGQLLNSVYSLSQENSQLHRRLESLSADIVAQGGVVLDGLGFVSEAQVKMVVLEECPEGDAFEVSSIPCLCLAVTPCVTL